MVTGIHLSLPSRQRVEIPLVVGGASEACKEAPLAVSAVVHSNNVGVELQLILGSSVCVCVCVWVGGCGCECVTVRVGVSLCVCVLDAGCSLGGRCDNERLETCLHLQTEYNT